MIYLKNIGSYNSVPFLYGKAFLLEVLKSGQIKINFTKPRFPNEIRGPISRNLKATFWGFQNSCFRSL